MCGRYHLTTPPQAIQLLFGFTGPLPNWPARFNIAPTQTVPIVRARPDKRRSRDGKPSPGVRALALVRWGLIPSWATEASIGAKLINARAESLEEKPVFRAAFLARRCLVPANGFYEWKGEGRAKQAYRIGLKEEGEEPLPLFAFAGLWELWERSPDGKPIESCTIVTTEANELLRPIHHRMPVILSAADYAAWLDPATPVAEALALLRPYPASAMMVQPVSARVNDVRFDDASCLALQVESEAATAPVQPSLF
ncbi:MAG TPA: SOS response-associated peptidase [Alphaproteobacteria bacterium]|nr:SOS response-associated peptidase [Alphaproteobacteria bacterium]